MPRLDAVLRQELDAAAGALRWLVNGDWPFIQPEARLASALRQRCAWLLAGSLSTDIDESCAELAASDVQALVNVAELMLLGMLPEHCPVRAHLAVRGQRQLMELNWRSPRPRRRARRWATRPRPRPHWVTSLRRWEARRTRTARLSAGGPGSRCGDGENDPAAHAGRARDAGNTPGSSRNYRCLGLAIRPYCCVVISVIVPAHNESRVIGRLLRQLLPAAQRGNLDIIVVANGCLDDTADIAAWFEDPQSAFCLSRSLPSRQLWPLATRPPGPSRGYTSMPMSKCGPVISRSSRRPCVSQGYSRPGRAGCWTWPGGPWTVRWYYDVWARLPEVHAGLFGRGVVALSEQGHEHFAGLPPVLADDLAVSLLFTPPERRIVPGAQVVVHTPRTLADLLRRRIRAAEGVAQIEQARQVPRPSARTRVSDLLTISLTSPVRPLRVALFLAVAVYARAGIAARCSPG